MGLMHSILRVIHPNCTTGDITLYVRTDGSNSNDGSANDSAHAFATIQYAINKIPQIVNHNVIINVAPGTYAEDLSIIGFTGRGVLTIQGDTAATKTRIVSSATIKRNTLPLKFIGFNIIKTGAHGIICATSNQIDISYIVIDIADATYAGIYVITSNVSLTNSTISNRNPAVLVDNNGNVYVASLSGTGNATVYYAQWGKISKGSSNTASGTVLDYSQSGGVILNADGSVANKGIASCTTTNLTYYVDTTNGLDTNDGLAVEAGHAFKTIGKAISVIPPVVNHTVTINVAAGTYAENVLLQGFTGKGNMTIQGDTVVSSTRTVGGFQVWMCNCGLITVQGFNATRTDYYNFTAVRDSSLVVFDLCQSLVAGSYAFHCAAATCTVSNSVASNHSAGIYSSNGGNITSINNSGTGNTVGINAGGGNITKSGTQPAGTTAEGSSNGLIINADGTLGGAAGSSIMGAGTPLPSTTGTMTVTMDGTYKILLPTGSCTLNAVGGYFGQECSIGLQTTGTTSYTITFGNNFNSSGVLATGTVLGKRFMVTFRYNGSGWFEVSRTAAY